MKPCNFPGRKNDRRKRALYRMAKPPAGLSAEAMSRHPWEITRLRILPDAVARGIRTKKDRSASAKFAR